MKNIKLPVIVGGLLVVILTGAFLFKNFKGDKPVTITSIKDALTSNVTLSCEFTEETGNVTKSYIKNGAVRVSMVNNDKANEIIIKDQKMYLWDEGKKEGFIYDVSNNQDDDQPDMDVTNKNISSSDFYLNMIDKYKDHCKVTTVSDSYFVIPADINFQDMNKLLENLKQQMPQTPASEE